MAVRISRLKWVAAGGLGLMVWLGLLAGCSGQEATATQAAALPTSTPGAAAAPSSAEASSPGPTQTEAQPAAAVAATPPSPTPTPLSGPPSLPQTAFLKLEVTSPAKDQVVTSDSVTVAGVTSPDATVSVNGILALPDAGGRFSVELTMDPDDNPLPVEVIATSVAGEQVTFVSTVIFIP